MKNKTPGSGATLQYCIEWTIQRFVGADLFFGHGTDNAEDEAMWAVLAAADLEIDPAIIDLQQPVNQQQVDAIIDLVARRIDTGKPLAYLVNHAWFAGLKFYCDERAIVPRSHIGEWLEEQFFPWVEPESVREILDLCTGSGCIAVALAKTFPHATVTASDLSADALAVAEINMDAHNVSDRVCLLQGDLYEPVADKCFDLIVCNPPYVSSDIMSALPQEYYSEPKLAFEGGVSGLDIIEKLLSESRQHLKPSGVLIVETGSASHSLEERYPNTPFTWLTSANGESVVFVMTAEELEENQKSWVS